MENSTPSLLFHPDRRICRGTWASQVISKVALPPGLMGEGRVTSKMVPWILKSHALPFMVKVCGRM